MCPLFAVTGVYCPGCGGLRAVNDLTNADLASAASSNLLFVASVPVLVFLWARWFSRSWRGDQPVARQSTTTSYVLGASMIALLVLFTVARNLPFASWLAP